MPALREFLPAPGADPIEVADAFGAWAAATGRPLYAHQEEALLALATGDHVVLATPTGSGKSLAAMAALARRFPTLRVMQNAAPRGFAFNQNAMMERATGRYLLPLNSDTVVQPGALAELVRFMDAHPRAGMGGPRLVHADGTLQPSCRNFPNAITHFLEASGLWRLLAGSRLIGRWYYLCGPIPFMQAVRSALIERGVSPADIQYEVFGPDLWQADLD